MTNRYVDAAYQLLLEAGTPLHYGEVAKLATERGLITVSQDRAGSRIAADLMEIMDADSARFVRLGNGIYGLNGKWSLELRLEGIGPIHEASLTFSDLTVLVGPQAGGKSIALQWLKLLIDAGQIQEQLANYGLDWSRSAGDFLDIYFGEGMRSLLNNESRVTWAGTTVDLPNYLRSTLSDKQESVFYIPAQRVLTLRDGWPRPFGDYAPGDPYVVRAFSERLRLLMEKELAQVDAVFPYSDRLGSQYRELLQRNVYGDLELILDRSRIQKRLVLREGENGMGLPYMVWSAGQREFTPLMLGLYWLMPPADQIRRETLRWAIIEEPEMGLHPRAIGSVLILVLELLARGYRVCISTHSPQVLDLVWSLRMLRETQAKPEALLNLFDVELSPALSEVAEAALRKIVNVYYFERSTGKVHDISALDPGAADAAEASWGGLTEFSGRANDIVANAVANDY